MRNTKIYSILKQFDKYEQNRCRKFLQSPYFNRDQTIVDLFNFLLDQINNRAEEEITKEEIWKSLNLDGCYDDVRFRKYASDLLKLVEDFLVQSHFESHSLNRATFLMEAIVEKKVTRLYNSSLRNAQHLLQKETFRSAAYYFYQYTVEKNYYEMIDFNIKRSLKSNVESISNNLDYFFLAEKLRYYCEVLSRQRITSHEYQILFIDEILQHLKLNAYNHVPPIAIYYQIYLTLSDTDNEENYYKLKDYILKYINQFEKVQARQIYAFAQNYCITKLNKGSAPFLKESFDLYVSSLENNVLIENEELAPWHFKNIVAIALKLKKFDWAELFINEYKSKLPESFRDNAVTYNLAYVYFYQKKFDKVVQLLQAVEYEDIFYTLDSKAILLSTYYELDETETLYFLFDSFGTLLNRHKNIPEARRKRYKDLIKFTKRLIKVDFGDVKTVSSLKQELASNRSVAMHDWLSEKVIDLEN